MTPPSISGPATDSPLGAFLRRSAERALDLLLPPHCVACDQRVLRQRELCGDCFSAITFIAEPFCDRCGLPFDSRDQAGGTCQACLMAAPAFRRGRAPFLYGDGIKRLLLSFKHGDRPLLARALAPHMARAGAALLTAQPILVPVPLHRLRLTRRRYNQAALLAEALAELTPCQAGLDVLRRVRATPSLDDRSAAERRLILDDAFVVHPRQHGLIAGKNVVLIDDVMTSGATADACARALTQAGATQVDVLVVARVPIAANQNAGV